jgi:hypothetical protein
LIFDGTKNKMGTLEMEVFEATIAATTEIPNTGERWFKSMNLNATISKEFLKPVHEMHCTASREGPSSVGVRQYLPYLVHQAGYQIF